MRDNGEGIPLKNLERVGEPNWTTRSLGQRPINGNFEEKGTRTEEELAGVLDDPDRPGESNCKLSRENPPSKKRRVVPDMMERATGQLEVAAQPRHLYGVAGEFLASLRHRDLIGFKKFVFTSNRIYTVVLPRSSSE